MGYYKVLVVDDEEEVREGIIDCVQWNQYGFDVVGNASNGEDALELAEDLNPDLVITDIKMPYMDGLEFIKRLSILAPTAKTIIITGFDDFNYAKTAIGLNVMEYIIKPINLEELTAVLINAKRVMDEESTRIRNMEFLRVHYDNSLPIIRESFIKSLIEKRIDEEEIMKSAISNNMDLNKKHMIVSLVKAELTDDQNARLLSLSIKKILDDTLMKSTISYTTMYMEYIVSLTCFEENHMVNNLIYSMNEVCKLVEKHFDIPISIGIGYIVDSPMDINNSYNGAVAALDYRVIVGNGKSIFIYDIEPNASVNVDFDEKDQLALLGAIRQADFENIKSTMENILNMCEEIKLPFRDYQIYLMKIIEAITSLASSFHIEGSSIFGDKFYPMEKLASFESKKEVLNWFVDICNKTSILLRKERQNSAGKLVDEAKEYVEKNYRDPDLMIEKMCNDLHVSAAYFSSLFKKETGNTFVKYITDYRLQLARKLLIETDLKTYLIAEKVGFIDANYFSFVFKKNYGMSPTKFRSGYVEKKA